MDDKSKETKNEMRELSKVEVAEVSGGFWGLVIAIILGGCATMPHKRDDD